MLRWLALLCITTTARAEHPLSLANAIQLARGHRSEVAQAEIDIRRARLGVLRAWLERAHLTISASFAEQAQTLKSSPRSTTQICSLTQAACSETHSFSAQANLTVPLWSGFRVEADLARAKAQEKVALAGQRATLNSIALDAATTYWDVRLAELTIDVARRSLGRVEEIERAARARVEAGIAPQVDLERAHVATLRQAETVAAQEGVRAQARAQLGAALQVEDEFVLTEDPGAHAPSLPPLEQVLADAARLRPELAGARAQVEVQAQAVRAAKGGYWPQISLFGTATAANLYEPNVLNMPNMPNERELFLFTVVGGLQVDWVLFDSLSTWTAVKDAGLIRDRAQRDELRTRAEVRADVYSAHGQLAAALSRTRIAAEAMLAARRALELLQKRYQVGSAILLEVLIAQSELTQLEGDWLDAEVATAKAEVALEAAIGRL
jgi:outer membrane protein